MTRCRIPSFPKGELGWHPNIPKHNVPWEVAQQPRGNRDNDSGAPGWYAYMPQKVLYPSIWYLTFLFHVFPQRGTAGCVSLSGTTTVTGYRRALRYSTPYYTEHAYFSNGVSTCSSRLRVVGLSGSGTTRERYVPIYTKALWIASRLGRCERALLGRGSCCQGRIKEATET